MIKKHLKNLEYYDKKTFNKKISNTMIKIILLKI